MNYLISRLMLSDDCKLSEQQKKFFSFFADNHLFIENKVFTVKELDEFMSRIFRMCPDDIFYSCRLNEVYLIHKFVCLGRPLAFLCFEQVIVYDANLSAIFGD